jgi:hypothetical protein
MGIKGLGMSNVRITTDAADGEKRRRRKGRTTEKERSWRGKVEVQA